MSAALAQQAILAVDSTFLSRVQSAILAAAQEILSEAQNPSKPNTEQMRQVLALGVLENPSSYVARFAWACAVNSNVVADLGNTMVGVASTIGYPAPAEVTTSANHGLSTGNFALVSGAQDTALNGSWEITVTGSTTFTVPTIGGMSAGVAGGTVTQHPTDNDIATAVSAAWNGIAGITNGTT